MVKKNKKIFKHTLDNGLTILVHPQHDIPKVSAQLWYNVGSKDEKSGERGLAHLIEHMIFKGTKRLTESDINLITTKLSGSCNAFTSYDYTGYLYDFPSQNWTESLDLFADCMRNCTFKEDLLTSELKAVIQELKMYRDYYSSSLMEELVSTIFYDHPYHHPIIGYKQDLWNLNREALVNFYHKHYVPNNATLVVVGDIEPANVLKEAQNYFGYIKKDPHHTKEQFYHTTDLTNKSVTLYRDIVQPMGIVAYPIEGSQAKKDYFYDILSWVVGMGKGSRLHKKLVDQLQLVTELEAFTYNLFEHGLFCVFFTPKKSTDIEKVSNVIMQELATLAFEPIDENELRRATKKTKIDYFTMLESNQRQANIIGKSYLATGDENSLFTYLDHPIEQLAPQLQKIAHDHLRPTFANTGAVLPLPDGEQTIWLALQEQSDKQDSKILDRKVRTSGIEAGSYVNDVTIAPPKPFSFPKPQKHKLSNGLEIFSYNKSGIDKIELVLEFKANHLYDPEDKLGLCGFVSEMLTEGTRNYSASEFIDTLESYGMTFSAAPGSITMSMLSGDLEKGLELLNEVVTNAIFDEEGIEKIRAKLIADIKNYWDNPSQFADQVARAQIYKDHPMRKGTLGTLEGILNISRDDLIDFYKNYFTPQKTRIALVGNISEYDIKPIFETTLGDWHGPDVAPLKFPELGVLEAQKIDYPINRDQVVLCFAGRSVKRKDKDFDKLLIFDQIFTGGLLGSMSSRLFQLREESGLFYTIGGSVLAHTGEEPGMVFIKTIVSCDRLDEAQKAIAHVIETTAQSITDEELEQARNTLINSLVDFFETSRQLAITFLFLARYNLPDDFFDNRAAQIMGITKEEVADAASRILSEASLITLRIGRMGKECKK